MNEENTNGEKDQSLTKDAIIQEAKRIHENCLHTSKSHFVEASFWTKFHLLIGIPTVVLAAIAGALAFASFSCGNILVGTLAIIVTILSAVATFLNPKERSSDNLTAGNNYDSLLTRVRIFWTIECRREESINVLEENLKSFSAERDRLNRESPQPPWWAYKKAKKGIEEGEAEYIVDKKSVEEENSTINNQ